MSAADPYLHILPYFIFGVLLSFFLTPIIGIIAKKNNIFSLPLTIRQRVAANDAHEHPLAKPRLGGVAIIVSFFVVALFAGGFSQQIWAMMIGLGILTVLGIFDDCYDVTVGKQLVYQTLAAIVVVFAGVSITEINVLNANIDLNSFESAFKLFSLDLIFIFPAHLFTIIWIVLAINAVNWVFGIDALGETLTIVASVVIALLSIKLGNPAFAVFPAIYAAANLGYYPFNFPPAKIIGGTVANLSAGYLIAVMSIIAGAKVTTSLVILVIPILDMLWVIAWRLKTQTHLPILKRPTQGGHVHLHHRLMQVGFSDKQTLYLESSLIIAASVAGFYFAGFKDSFLALLISISLMLLFFTVLSAYLGKKAKAPVTTKTLAISDKDTPPNNDDSSDPDSPMTPEQRYAY